MVKPPIVWGNLSFREEGRPDQKKSAKKLLTVKISPKFEDIFSKNLNIYIKHVIQIFGN